MNLIEDGVCLKDCMKIVLSIENYNLHDSSYYG